MLHGSRYKPLILVIALLIVMPPILLAYPLDTKTTTPVRTSSYIYVGGSGPGNYSSIQTAINHANHGDTIFIYSGVYSEHISINKQITIKGENQHSTIINGSGSGDVVTIVFSHTTLSNLTIQNSGQNWPSAAVKIINSHNTNLVNNSIYQSYYGIFLENSSYTTISENVISQNNYDGIFLLSLSNHNLIKNNYICSNTNYGIFSIYSQYNTITENIIKTNAYAMALGSWSSNNTIYNNVLTDNTYSGLSLGSWSSNNTIHHNQFINNEKSLSLAYYCNFNVIASNTFCSNHNGIIIEESQYNILTKNTIVNNTVGISIFSLSSNNSIYHNDFLNNGQNAFDQTNNSWTLEYPLGGNYWSDYEGEDLNGDGLGDIAYEIAGGDNKDLYPLMNPFHLYYLLNLSIEQDEIFENSNFTVTVTTIGGTPMPNALVVFDEYSSVTDENGNVHFIAPQVSQETVYEITASKQGYISATTSITVKPLEPDLLHSFIFGRIDNYNTQGDFISFDAVKTRVVHIMPFSFNTYDSLEQLLISKYYWGFVGPGYIFALCLFCS